MRNISYCIIILGIINLKDKLRGVTKNIVHLADSAKMKMIAINKHSSKLKNWSVEMPNAPYSNR